MSPDIVTVKKLGTTRENYLAVTKVTIILLIKLNGNIYVYTRVRNIYVYRTKEKFCHPVTATKNNEEGVRVEYTQEKNIENYLTKQVEKLGGKAKKWVCPGWDGAPDRIVLLPGSRIVFVELKRPGEKPRKLQTKRAEELRALGFKVCCGVNSKEEVDALLEELGR
ncbi:MAG: hypothetical protein RR413_07605 [Christensenellaceae bacterium]